MKTSSTNLAKDINFLDLCGVILIIIAAFILQFFKHELPCPLCILQRAGLYLVAFGLLMNINGIGLVLRNYAISGFGAMFMGVTALRQMLLHIVPGTGAYGDAVLGIHLYTWSLIIAFLFLVSIFTSMLLNIQSNHAPSDHGILWLKRLGKITNVLFLVLALFTSITTFMECGLSFCPDNPIHYRFAHQSNEDSRYA